MIVRKFECSHGIYGWLCLVRFQAEDGLYESEVARGWHWTIAYLKARFLARRVKYAHFMG